MLCNKCGSTLGDEAVFCSKCGMAVSAGNISERKSNLMKLAAIILASMIVLGGVIFAISAMFFGGGNCLAVTADSIINIAKLSSFDFNLSVELPGDTEFTYEGILSLGKDLKSSILDVTCTEKYYNYYSRQIYEDEMRLVFYNDTWATSDLDYGNEYYEYGSNSIKTAEIILNNLVGKKIEINSLVKNRRWDKKKIDEILGKIASAMNDFDKDEAFGVLEDFLYKECNKKDVLDSFVSGSRKKRVGIKTEYVYTVNLGDFFEEFDGYIRKVQKNGSKGDKVGAKAWADLLEGLHISGMGDGELDVIVVVGPGNVLHSLSFEASYYGESFLNVDVVVSNHNKAKLNIDDVKNFIEAAKKNDGSWDF